MQGRIDTFGDLLSRYRISAGLTQEALSAGSGLSVDAISLLERGLRRAPRSATVTALADALRLDDADREAFSAAAQRATETRTRHPPPSTPELRAPPSPLIGREDELARVRALLTRSDTPLVTLTGPPGVGKTRLALEVALTLRDDFADGVFAVALSPLQSAELVPAAIRRALGLREMGTVAPLETVIAFCRSRRVLLLLDTFEHLMAATPLVVDLLTRCPSARLLLTSRAPLRIRDEHELAVPPLRLPDPGSGGLASPEALASVPAVTLFVQRAAAVVPGFRLDAGNAAAVAGVCRRLDGLPLALELAAPWIRVMSPEELQRRLRRRLELLVEGPRDLPERQRTMRATLGWSHDLLDAAQRAVFRRASVFAGSAPLEGIESVCRSVGEVPGGVLPALARLVDQSLVLRQEGPAARTRIAMFEIVREYGRELLDDAGETDAAMRACAEYYLSEASAGLPRLMGPDQAILLTRLEWEHENVQAVLRWALQDGHGDLAVRLAVASWRYWYLGGHRQEGWRALELLLASAAVPRAKIRAEALHAAGTLAWSQGALERSAERLAESLDISRELGDRRCIANALNGSGVVAAMRGDYGNAESRFQEALTLYRQLDDRAAVAQALGNLAAALDQLGDLSRGWAMHEEALGILRQLGSPVGTCLALVSLAELARRGGDLDQAEARLEEAVALVRDLNAPYALAFAISNLADLERTRCDRAAARAHYAEGIRLFGSIGDQVNIASCVERLALLACDEGRPFSAARLYGAAAAMRTASGSRPQPFAHREHEQALVTISEQLGAAAFAAAQAAGAALSFDAALSEALGP